MSLTVEPPAAPSPVVDTRPAAPTRRARRYRGTAWRASLLVVLLAVLAFVLLLSIALGSKRIPFDVVWDGLVHFDKNSPDIGITVADLVGRGRYPHAGCSSGARATKTR